MLSCLTLRGYEQSEASERARRHILSLCIDGRERRPLMLANLAIAGITVKREEERQTVVIGDFYRHRSAHWHSRVARVNARLSLTNRPSSDWKPLTDSNSDQGWCCG